MTIHKGNNDNIIHTAINSLKPSEEYMNELIN